MGSKHTFLLSTTTRIASPSHRASSLLEEESSRFSSGQESALSSQEYPIKCILDESTTKYLIAWEGPFQPTWEPKHCANPAAVSAWVANKRKRKTAADKYRNQRPLRSSRQINQTLSGPCFPSPGTTSSPHSTQGSLQRHSVLASDAQPSNPSQLSQETVLSGSIFCPSIDSQASQPSGVTQSPNQLSQETPSNPSYSSQSINPTQVSGPQPSHTSQQFTPSIKPFQRRDLREIQETPLSHFLVDVDNSTPSSISSRKDTGGTPASFNTTTWRLSGKPRQGMRKEMAAADVFFFLASDFQTPVHSSGVETRSSLRTIPETVDQASLRLSQSSIGPETHNTTEDSPSFPRSSNYPRQRESQEAARLSSSLLPDHRPAMASQTNMNDSVPGSSSEHIPQDTPGGRYFAEMRRRREKVNSRIQPLQSTCESATPSSAGDIEPTAPPNASEGLSPLSHRTTGHIREIEQAQESPVPFVAPQALLYNVDHPTTLSVLAETTEQRGDQGLELSQPPEPITGIPGNTDVEAETHVLGAVQLAPLEFAITLSMDSRVKDDYDITLSNENKNIKKFIEISNPDEDGNYDVDVKPLFSKLQTMVEHLDNITTHSDLNLVNQPVAAPPDVAREASWAEYSSSKFQFFGYFIDVAVNHDLHVIIMAKQGKTIDILRNYFLGKGFTQFKSSDNADQRSPMAFRKKLLSFEIRTTSEEQALPALKKPSLIIALDSSFAVDHPSIQQLRMPATESENQVPIVHLLIATTAEHIGRCLPPGTDIGRLRHLVHYTVELSHKAGDLQDDALGVQEDAEETLAYLLSDPSAREWKLPTVEPLEMCSQEELAARLAPFLTTDSPRQKRWLDNEMDDGPSKRQRTTPFQDLTHISDSMGVQTQDQNTSISDSQVPHPSATSSAELKNLRTALAQSQARMRTMEAELSTLQHRQETKHLILHETRRELEKVLEAGKRSETRLERQKVEIMKLKDEKAALTKDLEEARNTIKSGGGLESELEKAKEEARGLMKDNSSLQRTVQQERSQGEYTRQQYQNASSSAAQSAMELRQLEDKVRDLEKKASGEAARLKELKIKNDQQTHLARVEELEAALAAREGILTRKEEEIRELRKNRPSTRATSMQPRSPKCGPSRSASPAPNSIGSAVRGSALKYRAEIS